MAILTSDIQFVGSLGNLSAYRLRGSNRVVLRRKGGASRARIRQAPEFENVRRNNAEFGGRATAAKWIMNMLRPQKALGDYNIAGRLNALLKPVQALDTASAWGQRHIQLSKSPHWLAGFSLNEKTGLDAVLRTSLSVSLWRATQHARVEIPALEPHINFFPHHAPWYSLQLVLGRVPDIFFTSAGYRPSSELYNESDWVCTTTPWQPVAGRSPAVVQEVSLPGAPPDEHFSLMLSLGIRYGVVAASGDVEPMKHAGSARVLAMA